MGSLDKIIGYFNIGIVPHSCATLSLACATYCFIADKPAEVAQMNIAFGAFNALIGLKQYWDYQDLKSSLEEFGWDDRIARQKSWSWCQRRAAKIATAELGYQEKYRDYLERAGFRWYHLLPRKPHA